MANDTAVAPLRVLIVDDEYYFRKLLVHLLDWTAMGFEIAAEAENGQDALELARAQHYDVIIADINMPRLTGLDFVKELRRFDKDTRIVFITSHDEFRYAQLAVSLGASFYLMKPVDEDELRSALNEVATQIGEVRALKEQAEQARPVLSEQHARQLLFPEHAGEPETAQPRAGGGSAAAGDNGYAVIVAQIDDLHGTFPLERDRRQCYAAVKRLLADKLQPPGSFYAVVEGDEDSLVMLAGLSDARESALSRCCGEARSLLAAEVPAITCTLSYGNIYKQINDVHLSYAEALEALKKKFTEGGDRVFGYEWTGETAVEGAIQPLINRNDWLLVVRNKDEHTLDEYIGRLCRKLIENRAGKERGILALMECISIGSAAILERYESLPAKWMSDEHPHFGRIRKLDTVFAMERWIRIYFMEVVFPVLDGKENLGRKTSALIQNALAYISENYMKEELNLQQTAKVLFVNPSYLSHLFKKETGKSFVEYLSDLRLEQAMQLLKSSSGKLTDIASQVGYADPYYFSKCFKRKFGFAPKNIANS